MPQTTTSRDLRLSLLPRRSTDSSRRKCRREKCRRATKKRRSRDVAKRKGSARSRKSTRTKLRRRREKEEKARDDEEKKQRSARSRKATRTKLRARICYQASVRTLLSEGWALKARLAALLAVGGLHVHAHVQPGAQRCPVWPQAAWHRSSFAL